MPVIASAITSAYELSVVPLTQYAGVIAGISMGEVHKGWYGKRDSAGQVDVTPGMLLSAVR